MLNRINNWHLSIMIIIVSIISLALIQKHVLAQWQDPTVLPSEGNSQIFFNPPVENLDLNGNTIIDTTAPSFILEPGGDIGFRISGGTEVGDYAAWFDGDVNVEGNLYVNGSIIEGGAEYFPELFDAPGPANSSTDYIGHAGEFVQVNQDEDGLIFSPFIVPSNLWTENGSDIYRNSNVGIGSTTPSKLLTLESNAGTDAAIALQSGNNNFWSIYNEESTNDLHFWNVGAGDAMTLTDAGELLIGTTAAQADLTVNGTAYFSSGSNRTVEVYNTTSNKTAIYAEGFEAIKGYSDIAGGSGIIGVSAGGLASNGVYGIGSTGVFGSSNASDATSYGVHGMSGAGKFGGYFSSTQANGAGVKGVTTVGEAGVWGVGTVAANYGVRGEGLYGVAGYPNAAGGAGVYGEGSATTNAAYFEGDMVIESYGGTNSFLKLDEIAGSPSAGDCDASHKGRMILDTSNNRLWVCSDVWRYTAL